MKNNKKVRQSCFLLTLILLCSTFSSMFNLSVLAQTNSLLDASKIPKWANQLEGPPPVFVAKNITDSSGKLIRREYSVSIREFEQQLLPTIDLTGKPTGFGLSKVWGFEGQAEDAVTRQPLGLIRSTPGCTLEAVRRIPIRVQWINNLVDSSGKSLSHLFPIDPTLNWANPNNMQLQNLENAPPFPKGYSQAQSPVPISIHLHGGEVPPTSDGNPEAWWTPDGKHGDVYNTVIPSAANSAVFEYPNQQQAATLWYHDHSMGITRLNVMSGLAGFYLLQDSGDQIAHLLPTGEYDIPLAIQDRNFLDNGQLYFPNVGNVPLIHPYWNPTFKGNTIMVNGMVWPNMNVKQGQYRLRLLDGSNSRFYTIHFSNNMPFEMIGSDGGYLKSSVSLTSLTISPGERADILLDLSNIPIGEKIILENKDPSLSNLEKETVGQIMQFTVIDETGFLPKTLPKNLNPTLLGNYPTLPSPSNKRIFTLVEQGVPPNTVAMLLDGQSWDSPVSETPLLGSTEDWIIVNPTMDSHPIHLHLVQFQLVERQSLASKDYWTDWTSLNGELPLTGKTINVDSLARYLRGQSIKPTEQEMGWKDTIQATVGSITVIRVRFAPQDGSEFSFDSTVSPGYVWHCHILDHEDNEMMRPFMVMNSNQLVIWLIPVTVVVIVVVVILKLLYAKRTKQTPNSHQDLQNQIYNNV